MCAPIGGLGQKAIEKTGGAALGGVTGMMLARKKKDAIKRGTSGTQNA